MATQQSFLVCDCSTLANFKNWAQAISAFFTTAGWLQSGDTGQVNWGTIVSPPGSGSSVYEVWQPNDGLTNFFLKIQYQNNGNCPSVLLSIGTSTNGAGTLTGFNFGPVVTSASPPAAPSTTAPYECDFSGAAGRIGVMLWRNVTNTANQLFAVERSVNSSGAYTSSYVTLWTAGSCSAGVGNNTNFSQRSLVFGVGAGPNMPNNQNNVQGGWVARLARVTNGAGNSASFNGAIPFDTPAPLIGYLDFPATVVGTLAPADVSDGVTFTVSLYGSTRTYMPSKNQAFAFDIANGGTGNGAVCLRYD